MQSGLLSHAIHFLSQEYRMHLRSLLFILFIILYFIVIFVSIVCAFHIDSFEAIYCFYFKIILIFISYSLSWRSLIYVPIGSSKMVNLRSSDCSAEGKSFAILISLNSWANDMRVSYNDGLWKMMPSVPPMQLSVNTHRKKRSRTIETNFQS